MNIKCSVCGIEVGEERNLGEYASTIPLHIKIADTEGSSEIMKNLNKEVIETFGKDEFAFCWVCWLKNLGVKPKTGDGNLLESVAILTDQVKELSSLVVKIATELKELKEIQKSKKEDE